MTQIPSSHSQHTAAESDASVCHSMGIFNCIQYSSTILRFDVRILFIPPPQLFIIHIERFFLLSSKGLETGWLAGAEFLGSY